MIQSVHKYSSNYLHFWPKGTPEKWPEKICRGNCLKLTLVWLFNELKFFPSPLSRLRLTACTINSLGGPASYCTIALAWDGWSTGLIHDHVGQDTSSIPISNKASREVVCSCIIFLVVSPQICTDLSLFSVLTPTCFLPTTLYCCHFSRIRLCESFSYLGLTV